MHLFFSLFFTFFSSWHSLVGRRCGTTPPLSLSSNPTHPSFIFSQSGSGLTILFCFVFRWLMVTRKRPKTGWFRISRSVWNFKKLKRFSMFLGEIWRIDFQISKLILIFSVSKLNTGYIRLHQTTVCNRCLGSTSEERVNSQAKSSFRVDLETSILQGFFNFFIGN
jgi:hypothetical protein